MRDFDNHAYQIGEVFGHLFLLDAHLFHASREVSDMSDLLREDFF